MSDTITLTGLVGQDPRLTVGSTGNQRLTFRLASPQRKYDKTTSSWIDAGTNWYSVTCFRRLAENAHTSLHKGDRVIVTGRLTVEPWEKDGKSGTNVEIVAETIGHDLFWGTSTFSKHTTDDRTTTDAGDPWASTTPAWDGGAL